MGPDAPAAVGARGAGLSGLRTLGCVTLDASPADTIDAATAAGFRSVGLRIAGRHPQDAFEPPVIGHPRVIADLRARLSGQGVRLSNVTAFHLHPEVEAGQLRQVVETVHELGAPLIVVNIYLPDPHRRLDLLGRYCEFAASAGISIGIEFVPFSRVRSCADALRLQQAVAAPNLGLVIDCLHLARSGGTAADLRRLPPGAARLAQLCDAGPLDHVPGDDELRAEARHRRRSPGEGVLPLADYLAALPADIEIEYEVAREDLRGLPLVEQARQAFRACNEFLDRLDRA